MLLFLLRMVITTAVIVSVAHILPGLAVKDLRDAIVFGLILGLINSSIRPLLVLLTLPISMMTLGLFCLVINIFTFWLASEVSYGIHILTFWGAFWGGFCVWVSGVLTNRLIWDRMY